jgi:hypothetical protein
VVFPGMEEVLTQIPFHSITPTRVFSAFGKGQFARLKPFSSQPLIEVVFAFSRKLDRKFQEA